jgi:CheY-like chemotaxis protein
MIQLNDESIKNDSFGIFLLDTDTNTLSFIQKDMPPLLVKDKNDNISFLDNNFNIFNFYQDFDISKAVSKIPFSDISLAIFSSEKKSVKDLTKSHFLVFAKCEFEKAVQKILNAKEPPVSYFLINNSLGEGIKFSHKERVPAKLESIIDVENNLEKILASSYPKEEELNDIASTIFNELILNAYEHGSLNINGDIKQEKMADGTYEDYMFELEQHFTDKFIDVEIVIYETSLLKISIKDSGNGFKYKQFNCKQEEDDHTKFHGRGIRMSNQLSTYAYYSENGTKATFYIKYTPIDKSENIFLSDEEILKNMSILYVEDDRFIRTQFSKILNRLTKKFFVAEDGEQGLEMYRLEHPDIVLTDIEMPKMNGLDMSAKIKEINSDQAIAIMTAYNDDEMFLRAIDIGIDKYFIKPVRIPQLQKGLHQIARNVYFKQEATRLMKDKEKEDMQTILELQSQNRHSIAQESAAFEKQKLIIKDDSDNLPDNLQCKIYYKPLEKLSGDIYGVIKINEKKGILYILDSMGKGLAASVTAVLSAAFINRSAIKMIQGDMFDFERLIDDYIDYIKNYLLEDECLSFTIIEIDTDISQFRYASSGMYPIVLKDMNSYQILQFNSNNPPFIKYLPTIKITDSFDLPDKFELFLFSDGLVETELFSMNDLIEHLASGEEKEQFDLFKKVMSDSFIADDDLTLIHFSKI